jgi:hypothetical protein
MAKEISLFCLVLPQILHSVVFLAPYSHSISCVFNSDHPSIGIHLGNQQDKSSDDLICWSPDGDSFFGTLCKYLHSFRLTVVHSAGTRALERELLGQWFKPKNNYGLYNVPHLQQGALRPDSVHESALS